MTKLTVSLFHHKSESDFKIIQGDSLIEYFQRQAFLMDCFFYWAITRQNERTMIFLVMTQTTNQIATIDLRNKKLLVRTLHCMYLILVEKINQLHFIFTNSNFLTQINDRYVLLDFFPFLQRGLHISRLLNF